MRERFRLPYPDDQTKAILTGCVMAEVQRRGFQYKETTGMEQAITATAAWLNSGEKCGMLYCGSCGNGKTTLMRAVRNLIAYCKAKDIDDKTLTLYEVSAKEVARLNRSDYKAYDRISKLPMLAIDDLGLEPTEVLSYGNVLNPVIDLLTYRYDEQLFTIVTTNLEPQQIREKYGDRIADRFNEMFARVVFTDKSFRK